jgi:sigma-E factor negative regulatory protein RseC
MMITRVEVVHLDQEGTTVRPLNTPGCGDCHSKPMGCCASRGERESCLIKPVDQWSPLCSLPLSLQVGQQLELVIKSSEILSLALLVYLSPVVGLLLGALLLEQLGVSEGWVVSGAFIAAWSCWLGARAIITDWIQRGHCVPLLGKAVSNFSEPYNNDGKL